MEPSSSNTGFFQRLPVLENQFHDDVSYQRIAKLFVPTSILEKVTPEIEKLGEDVLSQQIFDWITDAEKNQPYLRGSGRDAFGRPKSELIVTEGWSKLQDFGLSQGFVAYNYDTNYGPYNRLIQFLRCHLWEASCANTLCPAAMQDGAARLLQRHLSKQKGLTRVQRQVLQNAYDHLISRDPSKAWTSGQWMTERTGGSDVSQTETVAVYDPYPESSPAPLASSPENVPLGPWSISGFKWFSSATDSQMTILLAKTKPGLGVSAFFAPMRRHNPSLVSITGQKGDGTELNGVTIQRLKSKFGTQSLPTAELELKGMRGWLIGEEGKGIQEISTILNITRVHSSVSSMGYLGRSIAVAKAYALVREIGVGKGKRTPLFKHPLHMRTLANTTVDYHGMMLLDFYTLYILGLDEHLSKYYQLPASGPTIALSPPPKHLISPLLRVLSSLHKAYICETTIPLVFGCMESLGGVGYLVNSESEHINLARIFRDACVGAIWEGTTDLLSSDTLRALKHPVAGKESLSALDWFVNDGLTLAKSASLGEKVREEWDTLKEKLEKESQEDLLPEARQITFRIAEILMAVLYLVDAQVNPGREIEAMSKRYLARRGFANIQQDKEDKSLGLDLAIVYGSKGVDEKMAKL
ncbi:Acyl-CoA dehydrogenase/oxidase, N-terminal and middle domain containing protein [Naviculisporaceae sp. PSN 640]